MNTIDDLITLDANAAPAAPMCRLPNRSGERFKDYLNDLEDDPDYTLPTLTNRWNMDKHNQDQC